jgi:hypothetical protein
MSRDRRIEYPSRGATYLRHEFGVYEYSEYPESSVLAGQERRALLGTFPTLSEAHAAFPDAVLVTGSGYRAPALDHLSDDGDA